MAFVYLEGETPSTSQTLVAVGQSLAALGYLDSRYISNAYTAQYANAIKKFQRDRGYTADGVLTPSLESEIKGSYSNLGKARSVSTTSSVANIDSSKERTDTFFHSQQRTLTRRNNQDIKIVVGEQKQQTKTLKNVYFRSKGLVVDASGNPIAEQFEFIARDLEEN